MREEQAIFNFEIKKKSGSSIKLDIHHSKVPSSELETFVLDTLNLDHFFLDIHCGEILISK